MHSLVVHNQNAHSVHTHYVPCINCHEVCVKRNPKFYKSIFILASVPRNTVAKIMWTCILSFEIITWEINLWEWSDIFEVQINAFVTLAIIVCKICNTFQFTTCNICLTIMILDCLVQMYCLLLRTRILQCIYFCTPFFN